MSLDDEARYGGLVDKHYIARIVIILAIVWLIMWGLSR
jgi:hypothetical protein